MFFEGGNRELGSRFHRRRDAFDDGRDAWFVRTRSSRGGVEIGRKGLEVRFRIGVRGGVVADAPTRISANRCACLRTACRQ